jgi:hypothetical protein
MVLMSMRLKAHFRTKGTPEQGQGTSGNFAPPQSKFSMLKHA